MFGLRKKPAQQDTQIPYEVYETVQQPSVQRRRWIIRLVAALILVTLLIFGALALSRWLLNRNDGPGSGTSQSENRQNGEIQQPENLRQAPQQNTPLPASDAKPSTGQQSAQGNDSTVRKPE